MSQPNGRMALEAGGSSTGGKASVGKGSLGVERRPSGRLAVWKRTFATRHIGGNCQLAAAVHDNWEPESPMEPLERSRRRHVSSIGDPRLVGGLIGGGTEMPRGSSPSKALKAWELQHPVGCVLVLTQPVDKNTRGRTCARAMLDPRHVEQPVGNSNNR